MRRRCDSRACARRLTLFGAQQAYTGAVRRPAAAEAEADGKRRGGRRPVGRRGQGQDRRLAVASAPTSSCASRAATTPATRWSSATRPTSCRCCPRAWCAPGKLGVIGNGVVVDPWALVERDRAAAKRRASTSSRENLRIAENATLILPLHRELDVSCARRRPASGKIGTTGRGIGPAYEDKVGPPRHPRAGPEEPRHARARRSTACSCTTTRCGAASASRRSARTR